MHYSKNERMLCNNNNNNVRTFLQASKWIKNSALFFGAVFSLVFNEEPKKTLPTTITIKTKRYSRFFQGDWTEWNVGSTICTTTPTTTTTGNNNKEILRYDDDDGGDNNCLNANCPGMAWHGPTWHRQLKYAHTFWMRASKHLRCLYYCRPATAAVTSSPPSFVSLNTTTMLLTNSILKARHFFKSPSYHH